RLLLRQPGAHREIGFGQKQSLAVVAGCVGHDGGISGFWVAIKAKIPVVRQPKGQAEAGPIIRRANDPPTERYGTNATLGRACSRLARGSPANPWFCRTSGQSGAQIGGNACGARASAARASPQSSSIRRTRSSTDAKVISGRIQWMNATSMVWP